MKKWSSLEKIQYANILSIGIFVLSLVVEIYQYGIFDLARLLNIFNFFAAWYIFINIRKVQAFIKDTSMVLKDASDGELKGRIDVSDGGELENLKESVNTLLDQISFLAQDLIKIVKAASSKDVSVQINEPVFKGEFSELANGFKELLKLIEENERFLERADFSQELSKIGGGISGNLKLIENDVKSMSNKLHIIEDQSKQTTSISEDAKKDVEEVVSDIDDIINNIKKSNDSAKGLLEKIENITRILSSIREIADQTNMLSLNASIEAARAGEHGRGFAVVADEVRKLSIKTQKATDDITKVILELQAYSQQTSEEIDKMVHTALESTKSIDKLKDIIEEFRKSAKYNMELVSYISDIAELLTRKLDHIIFKHNVFTSVYRNKLIFDYKDENNCECGIWYNSDRSQRFQKYTNFEQIGDIHKKLHNIIEVIVDKLKNNSDLFLYKNDIINALIQSEDLSQDMLDKVESIINEEERTLIIRD